MDQASNLGEPAIVGSGPPPPGETTDLTSEPNDKGNLIAAGLGITGTVVVLLGLWAALTSGSDPILNEMYFPTIPDTLSAYGEFQRRTVFDHLGASLVRFVAAMVTGSVFGLSLGALMGRVPMLGALLSPIARTFQWLPPVLLFPLFIVWWGIGEKSTWPLAALGVASIVAWQTSTAVKERELGQTNALLDSLVGAIRVALPAAWTTIYVLELIGTDTGIGAAVWSARTFFRLDVVVAYILLAMVLAILVDGVLALIQRLLKS